MEKIDSVLSRIIFTSPHEAAFSILDNTKSKSIVTFIGLHGLAEYITNKKYRKALNSSDFIFCDSIFVQFINFYYNKKFKIKSPGPDVTNELLKLISIKNLSVGFFGGSKKLIGCVNNNFNIPFNKLEQIIPGNVIINDNLTLNDEALKILEIKSKIIFVGLGCPKQEILSSAISNNNKILIPIGAAINFLTNDEVRAPRFLRLIGFEWLWRGIISPKRVFIRNLKSLYIVLKNEINP